MFLYTKTDICRHQTVFIQNSGLKKEINQKLKTRLEIGFRIVDKLVNCGGLKNKSYFNCY
jgi:hypothetical protein